MKVKVTIVLDIDVDVFSKSAGIPRADVREAAKQTVIDAYLIGVESNEDEPDGIKNWTWS